MMSAPGAEIPELEWLERALQRLDFVVNRTGERLAMQAIQAAPAILERSPVHCGHWKLKVFFMVEHAGTARAAALAFAAQHGGHLSFKGQRVTVSTDVLTLDVEPLVAAYWTACRYQGFLDRGDPRASEGCPPG